MQRGGNFTLLGAALSILLAGVCGCDRMLTSRQTQLVKDAETKSAQGDFARAINLYEAALDDSESVRNAEVHYQLALLYDDKIEDPLSALHHFKRYLALAPTGPHAADVQKFMKRDEISLATSLSGDAVVTRAEAARLRNENLNLRKQIEQRAAKTQTAADRSATQDRPTSAALRRGEQSEKSASKKSSERTYVVQSGDTLASISRRFYHSSARWKEILDANKKYIDDPEKLRVGQSLLIP
jgi:LysM repeat protein